MYETILFDLDGTLTDPKEGITRCVQYALEKFGILEPDLQKLVPFIGPPLTQSFHEMYGLNYKDAKQAVGFYRERFVDVGMYENAVYPSIIEMLQRLQNLNKELIVATSKPTVYSVQILDHFKLSPYFEKIIGSNLDGTRVEKSEVIECVLSEIGPRDKNKFVMVGDRKHDILGAAQNGIDSIAVTYGYGEMQELVDAGPTHIISSINDLSDLLVRR